MTLPKELEEELKILALFLSTNKVTEQEAIDILSQTYAAGVKAGLMEAMKEAPNRRGDGCIADELHYEMWNSCRTEFLSRLEKRLNDGVQE